MPIHDWTRVAAGVFHDFHTTWIPRIRHDLKNGLLPPGYYATVEQVTAGLIPDILALKRDPHHANGRSPSRTDPKHGQGTVALATVPPRVMHRAKSERQTYAELARRIAIRHVGSDELVAVIEVVSPGNKHGKSEMRKFVAKAVELIQSGIHLLVIDLFPPTPRDPRGIHAAIWSEFEYDDYSPPADHPLTLASYAAGDPNEAFVQSAAVGENLPEMPLFLEPGEYINLPLESSYQTAFADVPDHWRDMLEAGK